MPNSDESIATEIAANDPCAVDLILEELQSGPMTPMTSADWNQLREFVREQPGSPGLAVQRY